MKPSDPLTTLHFRQVKRAGTDAIGSLVHAPAITVVENAPLREVRTLLLDEEAPAVAVVDPSASLCGVITTTDLLAAGDDWTAADAMSAPLSVRASTRIEVVADLMVREHAENVIVTDALGQVVGLVTARDIARHRAR